MKRLNLRVVNSRQEPGALSLRGGGCDLKQRLPLAGFEVGERVVLVSSEQLDELLRKDLSGCK